MQPLEACSLGLLSPVDFFYFFIEAYKQKLKSLFFQWVIAHYFSQGVCSTLVFGFLTHIFSKSWL